MADPFVIDCAHFAESFEQDKLGYFIPVCSCGWRCFPCPDEETAVDGLMQHAYEVGILTERSRHAIS